MGSNVSSEQHQELLRAPVTEPATPVAGVNVRFLNPTTVNLHLKEKSWDDFTIRDVQTDELYFRIDAAMLSMSQRKALLDANHLPVAQLKRDPTSFITHHFEIFEDEACKRLLFLMQSEFSMFKSELSLNFRNRATGKRCQMGVQGDWRAHHAVLWVDVGDGNKTVVARVRRPTDTFRNLVLNHQDYYIQIAPNVDLALIVLVCVAIDESFKD
ncbi:hypothetical protein Poli38472_013361 [Pythium oligandrum]|uniref:Uncharacterized protein n=1 Tax=Pythium oligandrum TaxID=41045 RepID=A0A8K1FFQ3_PYTOL|nr:hypothetical protein Poli38472_013361 [Pythium oligandrum]|eukprot:TMW57887.1 hypothetical protein Poli38472_013361 [Pythium oligandrum]